MLINRELISIGFLCGTAMEIDKKTFDFVQLRELRGRSIGRLMWRMKRAMDSYMEPRLHELGFTDFKTSYLAFLANIEEKGITNNELAKRACVTKQMMSKTVSLLESEGYIYTEKSETDSRSNRIFMNDRGFQLLYAVRDCTQEAHSKLAGIVGQERLEETIDTLRTLADELEKEELDNKTNL